MKGVLLCCWGLFCVVLVHVVVVAGTSTSVTMNESDNYTEEGIRTCKWSTVLYICTGNLVHTCVLFQREE